MREILVLKSAFSIVDQMFLQEIKNAEIMKYSCCKKVFIKEPESINNFIMGIMDPFKDKEEDVKLETRMQRNSSTCKNFHEYSNCDLLSHCNHKYEEPSTKITREFIITNMDQIVEILSNEIQTMQVMQHNMYYFFEK